MQSGILDLGHGTVRFVRRPGKGTPLVLVHELGGALDSWTDVVGMLPRDVDVTAYDHAPLTGGWAAGDVADFEAHVAQLHAVMDALSVERALVAGMAVGAGFALGLAGRHPDRVARVVAMAPATGTAADRSEGLLDLCDRLEEGGAFERLYPGLVERGWPSHPESGLERREAYVAAVLKRPASRATRYFRMLAQVERLMDLRAITSSVWLVSGRYDGFRPADFVRSLTPDIRRAEHVDVPSGHFMALQSPGWTAALLAGALRQDADLRNVYAEFSQRHASASPPWLP